VAVKDSQHALHQMVAQFVASNEHAEVALGGLLLAAVVGMRLRAALYGLTVLATVGGASQGADIRNWLPRNQCRTGGHSATADDIANHAVREEQHDA
jgi:hypothetical protein